MIRGSRPSLRKIARISRMLKVGSSNNIVICVHLVTQAGELHELPIQFQDVPHLAQAAHINLNFEHGATNLSGPCEAMQFISHTK